MQKGFSAILVIVGVVLILLSAGFFIFISTSKNQDNGQSSPTQVDSRKTESSQTTQNSDEPPLKFKSIGVNFEDFKFTKAKLQFNSLFMDYGFVIPANETSSGKDKANPQPTFILPLGTPVRSLVDGVVAAMPTLWSGDIS